MRKATSGKRRLTISFFSNNEEGADAAAVRRDQLALGQIHQGVHYSIFGQLARAETAKQAWDILKVSNKGVDRSQKSKLQTLRRLYDRCEMASTETVDMYFSRLIDLVNKMRLYGDTIEDESHDTEDLSIAELKGMIESHIERIASKSEPLAEEALKSQVTFNMTSSNQRGGGAGRGRGRGRGGFRGRGRGNSNQGRGRDCWYEEDGHENQANVAEKSGESSTESETLFLVSNSLSAYENIWFLDTGGSNHMCGKKELFSELDELIRSEVSN
ncbi:uncharacterized protein LOC116020491 [Ipomoea triloba]|uniref:uncharacterized protein LOC116020491 n=1 Tax=Ipomoea triloba TaxID=35885 RepID=UPI00125CD6FA|nr:uncharacterized protein LOC116020491 [Ipomoea triloba]